MVKVLLSLSKEEILVNEVRIRGVTAFTYAVRSGHDKVVKLLLEKDESQVNQADDTGCTLLEIAAFYRHEKID